MFLVHVAYMFLMMSYYALPSIPLYLPLKIGNSSSLNHILHLLSFWLLILLLVLHLCLLLLVFTLGGCMLNHLTEVTPMDIIPTPPLDDDSSSPPPPPEGCCPTCGCRLLDQRLILLSLTLLPASGVFLQSSIVIMNRKYIIRLVGFVSGRDYRWRACRMSTHSYLGSRFWWFYWGHNAQLVAWGFTK